jgi:hypothetical protein
MSLQRTKARAWEGLAEEWEEDIEVAKLGSEASLIFRASEGLWCYL